MALMNTAVLTGYADRIAKQYSYIKVCFDTLAQTGVGTNYYTRVTDTEDPDIELTMLQPAYNADASFVSSTTLSVVRNMSSFTGLISAFEAHLNREGSLTYKTWDGYCTTEAVRVSDYTNQVFYARNNSYMKARNVFCESSATFGTYAVGTGFTVGSNFGDGAEANLANGTNFAGTQVKAVVTGSNTISGMTATIVGLDEVGAAKTKTGVAIAGAPGTEITVGSTTDRWVAVTNITVTGGSSGDSFEVRNIKERTITL